MSKYGMSFTESVIQYTLRVLRTMRSGEIINTCTYNVYQALCESLGTRLEGMQINVNRHTKKYKLLLKINRHSQESTDMGG